jgi:hypothetical protein
MDNLIEALTIFKKYLVVGYHQTYPTACEHDVLIVNVNPDLVSSEDKKRLEELDFEEDGEYGNAFISFHYGSC